MALGEFFQGSGLEGMVETVLSETTEPDFPDSAYYFLTLGENDVDDEGLIDTFNPQMEQYFVTDGAINTNYSDLNWDMLPNPSEEYLVAGVVPAYVYSTAKATEGLDTAQTHHGLYSYASDGMMYLYSYGETDDGYLVPTLSDEEKDSLDAQYNKLGYEIGEAMDWSQYDDSPFLDKTKEVVEELTEQLISYIGPLLDPAINFHKTKNKKIFDNQISVLGSDTDETMISVSADLTSEYTS